MDALSTVMKSLDLNRGVNREEKLRLYEQLGLLQGKDNRRMHKTLMDTASSEEYRAYAAEWEVGYASKAHDPLVDAPHLRR